MRLFLLFCTALLSLSCDSDSVNQLPVAAFEITDDMDRLEFDASPSADPDGAALSYRWSSSSPLVSFTDNTSKVTSVSLFPGSSETLIDINLSVSDGKDEHSVTQTASFPPLTNIRAFGLGRQLTNEVSNSVPYEWYMDQGNTGSYHLINCGPTSVTMSIKWIREDFAKTPIDARNAYRSEGGWWYTSDIIRYLNDNYVNNLTISLENNFDALKTEIDKGNISILCLDMYHIPFNPHPTNRFDKFYKTDNTGWGHFIVVKGYKEIDEQILYEVYDPYSLLQSYADGSLKGKDRYYKASTLKHAVEVWWNYAIVVSKEPLPTIGRRAVNTDEIIHMAGQ